MPFFFSWNVKRADSISGALWKDNLFSVKRDLYTSFNSILRNVVLGQRVFDEIFLGSVIMETSS